MHQTSNNYIIDIPINFFPSKRTLFVTEIQRETAKYKEN